jgi:hypothetical protein
MNLISSRTYTLPIGSRIRHSIHPKIQGRHSFKIYLWSTIMRYIIDTIGFTCKCTFQQYQFCIWNNSYLLNYMLVEDHSCGACVPYIFKQSGTSLRKNNALMKPSWW